MSPTTVAMRHVSDSLEFSSILDPVNEAAIHFSRNDAPRRTAGGDYPASKKDLASAAERTGAPKELGKRIWTSGSAGFSGPEEFAAELWASPQPT